MADLTVKVAAWTLQPCRVNQMTLGLEIPSGSEYSSEAAADTQDHAFQTGPDGWYQHPTDGTTYAPLKLVRPLLTHLPLQSHLTEESLIYLWEQYFTTLAPVRSVAAQMACSCITCQRNSATHGLPEIRKHLTSPFLFPGQYW